jgi:tungstate transport system substrate-binding protein
MISFSLGHLIAGLTLSAAVLAAGSAHAEGKSIIVQSTTSTQNSGLFDHVLPMFEKASGIRVNVVAVGTGQAIKNASNCDGDVLFVHAKPVEDKFVADGYGVKRFDVMYNDFVIVGPASDPAKLSGSNDAASSLKKIAAAKVVFASRGDDSGTHKKELALWQAAGVDVTAASGTWYRETGSGMGATLNVSVGMSAYTMSDRATWIAFKNKSDFKIAVEGDKVMFNQYGIMQVNPEKCPNVKADAAKVFVDWVVSKDGQAAIASYKLDGQQLFFPNAVMDGAS